MGSELTLAVLGRPVAEPPFRVVALVGEEKMNALFAFRLSLRVPLESLDGADAAGFATQLLGSRAALTIAAGQGATAIRQQRFGILSTVQTIGIVGTDASRELRIDVTLVPRAHWLTLRKRSRVFQNRFVHEIVSQVLFEHQLLHHWSLGKRSYPRRQYCTQYEETDYAFVARLCAEEGLAFFFRHSPPGASPEVMKTLGSAGGRVPYEAFPTDPAGTIGSVGSALGAAGAVVGAVNALADSGALSAFSGGLGLVGDALRGVERDPDFIQEARQLHGSGGPGHDHGDVLWFVDDPSGYGWRQPDGPTRPDDREGVADLVLHLEDEANLRPDGLSAFGAVPSARVAPESVIQRDHDFRRPLRELQATAAAEAALGGTKLGTPLEIYEHRGGYDPPYVTGEQAMTRMAQLRADSRTAAAHSLCPRLLPGHVFRLETDRATSPAAPIAAGDYAVTRVRHAWFDADVTPSKLGWDGLAYRSGRAPGDDDDEPVDLRLPTDARGSDYKNEVECVSAAVLYRPSLRRRPARASSLTGVVVGPNGQEIHTDRFGRVKVQLHWDREGEWNAHSSCFLRVAQPWVGAGYGFQFIPRIGTEVLVTFIGGDPDRPVVTGCLYDATHPTPEPLPEHATRSAIRSQSSPGGGGFNEIVFEDEHANERLTIRAAQTLEEAAKGAHTLTVGEDQRVIIGGRQQLGVAGDRLVAVGGTQVEQVGGDRSQTVAGDAVTMVHGHRTDDVHGNSVHRTAGLDLRVAAEDDISVVGGTRSLSVRGDSVAFVGGARESVNAVGFVKGNLFANATGSVVVRGLTASGDPASKITLAVGGSSIEIASDRITLSSENVFVTGTTAVHLKGSAASLQLDDDGGMILASPVTLKNSDGTSVTLVGSDVTLIAGGTAAVEGSSIAMRSSSASGSSGSQGTTQQASSSDNMRLEFTHQHFVPQSDAEDPSFEVPKLAGVPCRIRFGNRLITNKSTNDQGVLVFHVPDGVQEVHVELLVDQVESLRDLYPHGPLSFLVKLRDGSLPELETPEGKRLRLLHLGYATSSRVQAGEMDELTSRACRRFQADQDLLDRDDVPAATTARLRRLYGS
jgi:type VI secretion system secreted protein VgrG